MAHTTKNLSAMQETQVRSLDWEDSLKKGIATHFTILAERIPWTEEPGGLQSMGSHRVIHNQVTKTFTLDSQVVLVVKNPPASAEILQTQD